MALHCSRQIISGKSRHMERDFIMEVLVYHFSIGCSHSVFITRRLTTCQVVKLKPGQTGVASLAV